MKNMYRIKFVGFQILHRPSVLCFSISLMVLKIGVNHSSPQVMGKYWSRLYWLVEVLDSRQIATYAEIFIEIGQLVRKISTDKPSHTDRHT